MIVPCSDGVITVQVTLQHIYDLKNNWHGPSIGLVKARPASAKLKHFVNNLFGIEEGEFDMQQADASKHDPTSVSHVGDVVYYQTQDGIYGAGQVWAHFSMGSTPLCLIQIFDFVSMDKNKRTTLWRVSDRHETLEVTDIMDPVIWDNYSANCIRCLTPGDIDL